VFSNSPCRETPKNALKKKEKKRRYVRTFFCELAQMYFGFSFFFCRPLAGAAIDNTGSWGFELQGALSTEEKKRKSDVPTYLPVFWKTFVWCF
jgi:hypothetical protein